MQLKYFYLLNRWSRRAMLRSKCGYAKRWGHKYDYEPNGVLLERLSKETGVSKTEVRDQLLKEREYLLSQQQREQR